MTGFVIELDGGAIRTGKGTDAIRVRYQYGASSGSSGDDDKEQQNTSKECEGYPQKFSHEAETRLRNGAFSTSSVRRVYVTVDSNSYDEDFAELYEKLSKHFPVTFVPRGYHGRSVVDRPV